MRIVGAGYSYKLSYKDSLIKSIGAFCIGMAIYCTMIYFWSITYLVALCALSSELCFVCSIYHAYKAFRYFIKLQLIRKNILEDENVIWY